MSKFSLAAQLLFFPLCISLCVPSLEALSLQPISDLKCSTTITTTQPPPSSPATATTSVTRRGLIFIAGTSMLAIPQIVQAEPAEREAVDMNAINAARMTNTQSTAGIIKTTRTLVPVRDPPPFLNIRGGIDGKSGIKIPRIGYSFYKTATNQADRCTGLALRSGIRHLDIATQYESNGEISKALKKYLDVGIPALDMTDEKAEVLDRLDQTARQGETHAKSTIGGTMNISPAPLGSAGRRGRRDNLFLSHKISNEEQSTDVVAVRRTVKKAIQTLGCSYLDLVSIHSPLTDKDRRLASYQALLDLRESGFIKSVGVCNYGVAPLQEIMDAGLELPAINQLELSPFNTHPDIVEWCDKNGVAISCSAWSKLSSATGPTEGWDVLAKLAQEKGMTKAQVLVRWALQKGYVCVPRSGAASKVERIAIAENSYGGVNPALSLSSFILSKEEMGILDSLNINFPAGTLGRRDGWTETDITGPTWEPTNFS